MSRFESRIIARAVWDVWREDPPLHLRAASANAYPERNGAYYPPALRQVVVDHEIDPGDEDLITFFYRDDPEMTRFITHKSNLITLPSQASDTIPLPDDTGSRMYTVSSGEPGGAPKPTPQIRVPGIGEDSYKARRARRWGNPNAPKPPSES